MSNHAGNMVTHFTGDEWLNTVNAVTRTKVLAQNFFIYLFTVKVIRDL